MLKDPISFVLFQHLCFLYPLYSASGQTYHWENKQPIRYCNLTTSKDCPANFEACDLHKTTCHNTRHVYTCIYINHKSNIQEIQDLLEISNHKTWNYQLCVPWPTIVYRPKIEKFSPLNTKSVEIDCLETSSMAAKSFK